MTPRLANSMGLASRGAASRMHGHWVRRTSTALLWLVLLASTSPAEPARSRAAMARLPDATPGESIYRRGMLATGEPVRGERASAPAVPGAAAACSNCHRRSGLGALE